jgi:hypothetical protein
MSQTGNRGPQQRHRAGDVRSRHGRAAGSGICIITAIARRARARARSTDIGLDTTAAIGSDRAATAKPSNRVGTGL